MTHGTAMARPKIVVLSASAMPRAMAITADGGYVVTWTGTGSGDFWGVFASRFASDGARKGDDVVLGEGMGSQLGNLPDPAILEIGIRRRRAGRDGRVPEALYGPLLPLGRRVGGRRPGQAHAGELIGEP